MPRLRIPISTAGVRRTSLVLETSSASSPARGRRLRPRWRCEGLSTFAAWRTTPSALVREDPSILDPTRSDPCGGGGGRVALGQATTSVGPNAHDDSGADRALSLTPDWLPNLTMRESLSNGEAGRGSGAKVAGHVVISEHALRKKPSSSTPRAPGSSTRGEHCVECAMSANETVTLRWRSSPKLPWSMPTETRVASPPREGRRRTTSRGAWIRPVSTTATTIAREGRRPTSRLRGRLS